MSLRNTSSDFTTEEAAEVRLLLKYADSRRRLSTADLDRLSMLDPYLYPISHCARMSACLDVDDGHSLATSDTDTTGLNEERRDARDAREAAPFAWRQGRLRRLIRLLVQRISKRSR